MSGFVRVWSASRAGGTADEARREAERQLGDLRSVQRIGEHIGGSWIASGGGVTTENRAFRIFATRGERSSASGVRARRDPRAGAGDRRQHRHLQRRQHAAAAAVAVPGGDASSCGLRRRPRHAGYRARPTPQTPTMNFAAGAGLPGRDGLFRLQRRRQPAPGSRRRVHAGHRSRRRRELLPACSACRRRWVVCSPRTTRGPAPGRSRCCRMRIGPGSSVANPSVVGEALVAEWPADDRHGRPAGGIRFRIGLLAGLPRGPVHAARSRPRAQLGQHRDADRPAQARRDALTGARRRGAGRAGLVFQRQVSGDARQLSQGTRPGVAQGAREWPVASSPCRAVVRRRRHPADCLRQLVEPDAPPRGRAQQGIGCSRCARRDACAPGAAVTDRESCLVDGRRGARAGRRHRPRALARRIAAISTCRC